jgi:serine/threonine protein phosphatase 1
MRWIIGDIHGMAKSLQSLIEAVMKQDRAADLMFAGDYVNRGPDSRQVIELLLSLNNARFVRGNHDDIFDLLLRGQSYISHPDGPSPLLAFGWFLEEGLDLTLSSYGVSEAQIRELVRRPNAQKLTELLELVPTSHRQFIASLPPTIEEKDLFVVHATWDIHTPTEHPPIAQRLANDGESRHMALWGRFSARQVGKQKAWEKRGFFGHTPVANYLRSPTSSDNVPIVGPQIVLLDTAAALGGYGRLTAFCPDTQRFIQVDPLGRLVERS